MNDKLAEKYISQLDSITESYESALRKAKQDGGNGLLPDVAGQGLIARCQDVIIKATDANSPYARRTYRITNENWSASYQAECLISVVEELRKAFEVEMDKTREAINVVSKQLKELREIRQSEKEDSIGAYARFGRWKSRTVELLEAKINIKESRSFNEVSIGGDLYKDASRYENFLQALYDELKNSPDSFTLNGKNLINNDAGPIGLTGNKIFIGHGRSLVWRDLKDFVRERLGLEPDEFDGQPAAGMSIAERLQQMLNDSCFAFLLMTAEDERADGSVHARENVVHEIGLFQGRLGFRKAIVLLEEGCREFSNITGLVQIRFPKGDIRSRFEEIRRVLEREQIIG